MKNCEKIFEKVKRNFISMDIINVCKPTVIDTNILYTDTNIRYTDVDIYPDGYKEVDRLIQKLYENKDNFRDKDYSNVYDLRYNWDQFENYDDMGWISSSLLPLICLGLTYREMYLYLCAM
jgi:hypothetical protein